MHFSSEIPSTRRRGAISIIAMAKYRVEISCFKPRIIGHFAARVKTDKSTQVVIFTLKLLKECDVNLSSETLHYLRPYMEVLPKVF